MPVRRDEILAYLHDFLRLDDGGDYAFNGLQVEGCAEVSRVVLGVSAGQELFAAAVADEAELVVVHHGLFFGTVDRLTGLLARRVRTLLENEISLAAYHLPLDRHPEIGNNAVLCRRLGVEDAHPFGLVKGAPAGLLGELPGPALLEEVAARLQQACGQPPRIVPFGPRQVERVAVVTGAGADLLPEAAALGAHVFVTGEGPERAHEQCRELGLSALFGGHYATERFGVQALAEVIAGRFDVTATFVDVPNPL
jgi:dinuclear metal center YbgI/SA1388 family protein